MTMSSAAIPSATFAARCFKVSRVIHWITVALVCGLLLTALFGGIDPHGAGNTAFLWHSSLGIALYLLSISRVLLWLIYRPMADPANDASGKGEAARRGLQIAFYALLIALPISGWFLASEEGTSAHLLGIPALPQWYFHEAAQESTAIRRAVPLETTPSDTSVVVNLIRIHVALAAALSVVVAIHIFTVVRDRSRRHDQRRIGMGKRDGEPNP
jgi:cytochrome b561